MKTIVSILFLIFLSSLYAQKNSDREIDTTIFLGAFHSQVLQLDSAKFVHLSIAFDHQITTTKYNADSIIKYQDLLFQRLELSNIDTLFIEGFLEKCDVGNILSRLKNISVVQLLSYGSLQILSKNITPSQVNEIHILAIDSVEVDLSALELLKTRILFLDVEQENKIKSITISNNSTVLESLILDTYFPRYKKFIRKNRLRTINDHIEIKQADVHFRRLEYKNSPHPHGKKRI